MSIATEKDSIIQALNRSFSEHPSSADDRIHVEFNERVQTFVIDQKWLARSVIVSPAVCAQYGWKCLRPNLLMCVTCRATLSSGEVPIDKYETYKSCAEKLLLDVKGRHNTHCPWPFAPCPANFVKMVPMHKYEAQYEFEKRFKTLLSSEEHLPLIKDPLPKDSEENGQTLSLRFKVCNLDTSKIVTEHRSAFSLAVTGWSLTTGSKSGKCLACKDCHRSASLLMYSTSKNNVNVSTQETLEVNNILEKFAESNGEPKQKRQRLYLKKEPFDPLYEHRPWCLWINDGCHSDFSYSTQNSSLKENEINPSAKGWEIFLSCCTTNTSSSDGKPNNITSPSKEEVQVVRDMISVWTEAFV